MSAWDITGAIVWPLTAILMGACSEHASRPNNTYKGLGGKFFIAALLASCGTIFCIARLCGAHL